MNLYNISKSDSASRITPVKGEQLRSGQIVQGRVLKLYPENKADIQLGGKRLIANLEVGLQVGVRYHFQVQSTANVIQLKVLGEELKGKSDWDASRLLHHLGLRSSKSNMNFVNSLFGSKVPFDHQQLAQAVHLLRNEKDKPAATRIIIEMIARKLPIHLPILRALSETKQTTVTQQFQSVMQQMKPTPNTPSSLQNSRSSDANVIGSAQEKLMTSISAFIDRPLPFKMAFIQAVLENNKANNQSLFRTLQGLGLVSLNIDFTQWISEWNLFAEKGKIAPVTNQNSMPFQLNEQAIMQTISNIYAQRSDFDAAINKWMSQWGTRLNTHQLMQSGIGKDNFSALQQMLKQDIFPFLNENQRLMLGQLMNSLNNLSALYQSMQSLAQGNELDNLLQSMQKTVNDEQFLAMTPKQQFLQHQNLFLRSFGFDYENQLIQSEQSNNQNTTIKGMILQLLSSSEAGQTEANQKLLHFINGMQIKSVHETPPMVQANIQIPAERLGLIKDIELDFEGRKTKKDEIDPDFCRILFHLNLKSLGETVIDMNIQQRKISLTVFNDYEEIHLVGNLLKNKLKLNLENLGYELTVLQYKKIEEKNKSKTSLNQSLSESEKKGVDFRI